MAEADKKVDEKTAAMAQKVIALHAVASKEERGWCLRNVRRSELKEGKHLYTMMTVMGFSAEMLLYVHLYLLDEYDVDSWTLNGMRDHCVKVVDQFINQ